MARKNPALAPGGLGSRFLAAQLPPALAPGGIGARFQAAQQQPTSQPFTPYQAPPLPSGFYDPNLDAQLAAAQRGLGDTTQDYATQASRNQIDYGLQQDAINLNQSRGLADYQTNYDRGSQDLTTGYNRNSQDLTTNFNRGSQDLNTGYSRGTQDLNTGFSRGNEDLDRSVMLLQRSYSQLQNRQSQDAAAAGVSGGAALQAAAKRAANMAIDRQPLDTSRARLGQDYTTNTSRLGEDYRTNTSRLGEDYTTNSGRLGEDYSTNSSRLGQDFATGTGRLTQDTANQLGQLGIGYQRTTDDAATALARAQREAGQFGIDTEAQKAFQVAQSGYVPPPPPKKRAVLR